MRVHVNHAGRDPSSPRIDHLCIGCHFGRGVSYLDNLAIHKINTRALKTLTITRQHRSVGDQRRIVLRGRVA